MDKRALRSFLKHHIATDTALNLLAYDADTALGRRTIEIVRLAKAVMDDARIAPSEEPSGTTIFPLMDRVAHHRPGFAMTWSMYSSRIQNYEALTRENLHGWDTGWGMVQFHNAKQLDQYQDGYWPTVDPHRLPGTTVDQRMQGEKTFGAPMVGGVAQTGVAADNSYGVVCQQIGSQTANIGIRKSWMIVGDFVVCVGSNIRSTAGSAVETIIDNRKLNASNAQKVYFNNAVSAAFNTAQGPFQADSHSYERPTVLVPRTSSPASINWVSIDDVGGYVLLGPNPPLMGLRARRQGRWRDINTVEVSDIVERTLERQYATLWLDHGSSPANDGYAYVCIPNADRASTASFASAPPVEISRTNAVHYVKSSLPNLTVYSAVFWEVPSGAPLTAGVLTSDAPVAISVKAYADQVVISLSDPTQLMTSEIKVTVALSNSGEASKDSYVSVDPTATSIEVKFRPSGLQGATRTVTVS